MSMTYKWFLVVSMVAITMFRANYYGYSQGVWSWIMIITAFTPFILQLRNMLIAVNIVYVLFHITFFDYWGMGQFKDLAKVGLVFWAFGFLLWLDYLAYWHGPTLRGEYKTPGKSYSHWSAIRRSFNQSLGRILGH